MDADSFYFINKLMAKSSADLPKYRHYAIYKDQRRSDINDNKVRRDDTDCIKCGSALFVLNINGTDFCKACGNLNCDFAELNVEHVR